MYANLRSVFLTTNSVVSRIPAISNVARKFYYPNAKNGNFYKSSGVSWGKMYCTSKLPQDKNVFGDLGFTEHAKTDLNEAENVEEEFLQNEARLPRRLRLSPGKYADLIKAHLGKLDLQSALGVLELAKKNRDPPTLYMYNLLIRAFAIQGDMKQCFRLYSALKKRGLQPNDPTYTSLLTSIANTADHRGAMEKLTRLRETFIEKNVLLNTTHYNAIINAYGRHGKLMEAFQMADEMRDRRIEITLHTFNTLLCCAISDKESGMRHVLYVWHLMKRYGIKPETKTFNLLLRAMRETQYGDLKVDDILLKGDESSRIGFNDRRNPDLLATPPTFGKVPIVRSKKREQLIKEKKELARRKKGPKFVDARLDRSTLASNLVEGTTEAFASSLNEIHSYNPLILFGGYDEFLEKMRKEDAVPDVKTITLLMELSPNSVAIETSIIREAKKLGVPLDIDFYNVLIKKRSFRHEYDSARQVLFEIEMNNLTPDIMTWGSLALTCDTPEEVATFLETMDNIGFMPNSIILGTLIIKLTRSNRRKKFEGMVDLLFYMTKHDIKLTTKTIEKLDEFIQNWRHMMKMKDPATRIKAVRENYLKFCKKYEEFKKKMMEKDVKQKAKYKLNN